jgi:hypothetical protein
MQDQADAIVPRVVMSGRESVWLCAMADSVEEMSCSWTIRTHNQIENSRDVLGSHMQDQAGAIVPRVVMSGRESVWSCAMADA